ncbi:HAD-IA family hydrolase [Candidatus Fermentibacteria bacterium]|nr:HAD-IA family hydrolase [Candidatus Fermentibacteria bacterium]
MIKAVFFDLFGTLFVYGDMKQAWCDWLHFFYESMKGCGLMMQKEDFSKACDLFFGKDEPEMIDAEMTVFEGRIKALSTDLGLDISKNDVTSIADLIVGKWQEQISIDSDAIPTIQQLKRDKIIGLVSNFDHPPHVRRCLSKYGMDSLFDTVVISGEVGVKKPNSRIFKPALKKTNLNAGEVAYVGDTQEDIMAAETAGMVPILIERKDKRTNNAALDYSVEQQKMASVDNDNVRVIAKLPDVLTVLEQK